MIWSLSFLDMSLQTMDFFGAQDRAKANTFKLGILFFMAVIFLCLGMYLVIDLAHFFVTKEEEESFQVSDLFNFQIFILSIGGTLSVIIISILIKASSLSGGGEKVATMLGGEKINPMTQDPHERKVLNVVEEMAIASGVPTPDVYQMPSDAINAFAAGTELDNAVIGVTVGCIEKLSRDELQGVIAHEFSHILNQDMKINIRLMGIVFGIMVIAIIGRYLLEIAARSGGGDNKKGALPFIFVGLAIFVLGSAGLFFSRWIKSSISKQREYLADAAAVQFTRNPDGIAGALKKIGASSYGSKVEGSSSEEASHMFFANVVTNNFAFATHPPLTERIRRIDPNFDGKFGTIEESPKPKVQKVNEPPPSQRKGEALPGNVPGMPEIPGLPGGIIVGAAILDEAGRKGMAQSAENASESIGHPTKLQLDYATELRDKLPEQLMDSIHQPMTAIATIFALLIDPKDPAIIKKQKEILKTNAAPGILEESEKALEFIKLLDHQFLLPLAELAAPALRELSASQYNNFKSVAKELISADESIDLFEYTLDKMLESSLDTHFKLKRKPTVQYYSPVGVSREIDIILSCLAYNGSQNDEEAEKAFLSGRSVFQSQKSMPQNSILEREACTLSDVNKAIDGINACSLPIKKSIVQAVGKTIAADGEITRVESELMRAICYGFGCPVPPFVG